MMSRRGRVDRDGYGLYDNSAELIELHVNREAVCCPLAAVLIASGLMMAGGHVLVRAAVVMIAVGVMLLLAGLGAPGSRSS